MAMGYAWASGLLIIIASVFVFDKMGLFKGKNKFPVDGRVNQPSCITGLDQPDVYRL